MVLGIAADIYDTATSPTPVKTAVTGTAGLAGAWAGATVGGGIVGGVVGGILGGGLASDVANEVESWF